MMGVLFWTEQLSVPASSSAGCLVQKVITRLLVVVVVVKGVQQMLLAQVVVTTVYCYCLCCRVMCVAQCHTCGS